MNYISKIVTALAIAGLLSIIFVQVLTVQKLKIESKNLDIKGAVNYNTAPRFVAASSTAFTLTTTSQRLLASSTPTARLAATIQPVNCTTSGTAVYLSANRDVPAVAGTGFAAFASSTLALGDYPNTPVPQGSVTGITQAGTCTVLVTEWRSQY